MERATSRKTSDFSIASILGCTLDDSGADEDDDVVVDVDEPQLESHQRFEWLHCTRYRPPRLPSKCNFFLIMLLSDFCCQILQNNHHCGVLLNFETIDDFFKFMPLWSDHCPLVSNCTCITFIFVTLKAAILPSIVPKIVPKEKSPHYQQLIR
jgi:hypothetical protein